MRIVIDAQPLLEPLAGIGHYTNSLLCALAIIDHDNDYFLYYGASFRQRRAKLPCFDNCRFHPCLIKIPGKIFRPLTEVLPVIPLSPFFRDYDLFHGVNYFVPRTKLKSLVNIYDLSVYLFPGCFTRERLRDVRGKILRSAKRAQRIITGSEHARRDIVSVLSIPREKVVVIANGVDNCYHPVTDTRQIASLRRKYNLPEHIILHVGTIEPRKNISALIRAFGLFVKKEKQFSLVLAGRKGWLWEDILSEITKQGLEDRVVLTGYLSSEELPLLYNCADIFVFPSLYEGFGFPPLEAMACGVPVITSNSSSLPEVVGEAGIMVSPDDVLGLAEQMERLANDTNLRNQLREHGLERAKQFTWEKCARATLRLYREMAET